MIIPSPADSAQSPSSESPSHQVIQRVRRSTRRWCWSGGALLLASITWAVWEQPDDPASKDEHKRLQRTAEPASGSSVSTLNEAAFASVIWRTPSKPMLDVALPPPPPALRLQLLAIDSPPGQPAVAILYDQERDVVSRLAGGATYRGYTIAVFKDRVVVGVSDTGGHSTTLLLEATAGPVARDPR